MVAADPPFDPVSARTSTTARTSNDPSEDAASSAEPPLATAEGAPDLPASVPDGEENAAAAGGRTSVKPTRNAVNESAVVEVLTGLSEAARLEAILYLKGRPMSLGELAALTGMDRDSVELALISLMTDYAHRDTALEIFQDGQTYSLQLRQGLSDLVQVLLPVDLSTAALRTLATIALKKRILQSDLVDLRGSGAYDHIKELLAQNFIERKRQSDGRSYWLTLSEKFHRTFAIDQQGPSLPQVAPLQPADAPASDYLV
jgi:segregation and condensation protein B